MKTLKLLAFTFILLCAFSFAPSSVKFEYTFKVGDQYEWTQNTKQTIKQSVMGMDQVIENNITGALLLKVTNVTPTGAIIESQYTTLSMAMKLPGGMGEQVLNSSGDTSKIENKVMRALMNKPFTITVSKLGVIEKIEGEENLWSDFPSLGLNEQQLSSMKASLEQTLSESSLKTSFEMIFINYPDKKIKIGDSWKNKTAAGASFPLETENTWVLSSLTSDAAKITGDGIISTTDKEKVVTISNGLKSKFDLAGTQKTVSTINLKTGWASAILISSDIKGKMMLLAGGMIPQDMEVPMQILTETNSKLVRK